MNSEKLTKELIKQGESEQLEFLDNVENETIAKTLCGFLNGSGGRVLIGVDDKGKVTGLADAENCEQELKKFLVSAIIPDAPINYSIETVGEKKILNIKVWGGSSQPYIYDGSIFYRRGANTEKATSREISELIHDRHMAEKHWERQIAAGVQLSDLSIKLIRDTIQEARRKLRTNFAGNDVLEFLSQYGLYVNGSFTNACVILFAKSPSKFLPQIRVRLTEYPEGKTGSHLLRDEVLEGNLFEIRDRLEEYTNGLGIRSVFDKNRWKRIDFTFPKDALQEGIINALMHRDYSSFSSTVSISVYPDRFVISNSGKLPEEIRISDLKRNHDTHPVNPDIAQIVFLRGLIDKLGKGTIKIIEECKASGLKMPEWKETASGIVLTFHGPKALAEKKSDNDAVSDAVSDAVKRFVHDAVNDAVGDAASDAVIIRLANEYLTIWSNDGMNLREIMAHFDVARATAQRDMALLKAHKFIVFEGSPKTGVYKAEENFSNKIKSIV